MSRLDSFSGKMMDLVGQVGDNLRGALPDGSGKWLQTGAAIGVARTGTRVVGSFVRRNPAVIVAAAVGAGAAWYAVHRYRRKQQANGGGEVFEGQARRIEPRRAPRKGASDASASESSDAAGTTAPRRRRSRSKPSSDSSRSAD